MKKLFPLTAPDRVPARVLDSIKHDVRKYVKRERKKTLPEGFDLWDFNCRVGVSPALAASQAVKEIGGAIDDVAKAGGTGVYVEILAVAGHRIPAVPAPPRV